jgi:hypothetical protein
VLLDGRAAKNARPPSSAKEPNEDLGVLGGLAVSHFAVKTEQHKIRAVLNLVD